MSIAPDVSLQLHQRDPMRQVVAGRQNRAVRKARAMNDGRVIRQALGDAGRTWVRRALEQGYELSEVARATLRLDDGEVFGTTRQRFESTTSVISRDRSSHRLAVSSEVGRRFGGCRYSTGERGRW